MLTAAIALLMQVGPNPSATSAPAIPPELDELRRRQRLEQPLEIDPRPDRLRNCLRRSEVDSTAARTEADAWLAGAQGAEKAQALHCRGYAHVNLGQWGDAARSFLAARDTAPGDDAALQPAYRARLGVMAANALLTAGDAQQAIGILDRAKADAAAADFPELGGEIELDRARAFVALDRNSNAAAALASARALTPGNARAWLLSATLSRREDDLAAAQTYIERANLLDPANPEIGLEAGVVAVLSGNDDAARKSWNSVLALAPDSAQAQTAQSYLEQLRN